MILLIHQFTGMSAVVGCAAILVSRHRDIRRELSVRRGTTALAAGLVACIAVIAVWPYYHLWEVNQGQLDVLDPVHRALYKDAFAWYGPGLILGLAGDRVPVVAGTRPTRSCCCSSAPARSCSTAS